MIWPEPGTLEYLGHWKMSGRGFQWIHAKNIIFAQSRQNEACEYLTMHEFMGIFSTRITGL